MFSVMIKVQCLLSRIFKMERRSMLYRVLVICGILIFLSLMTSMIHVLYSRRNIINALYIVERETLLTELEANGWGRDVIRKAPLYISPNNETALTHANENICSIKRPLVLIIVCSDTKNNHLRKAIRETWASDAGRFKMLVLFLVGISRSEDINKETSKESAEFKDIITENVVDTYNNLTLKSIYMLKWVKRNCMHARFLMKADDDAYINIENLYDFASTISDSDLKTFLVGNLRKNVSPERDHLSKWYMPMYIYADREYPTYLLGVAYLMSAYVAEKLYYQSLQTEFNHLEDVYITGMCALLSDIHPSDNFLFHFWMHYTKPELNCKSSDARLITLSHHSTVPDMYRFYEELSKC